MVVAFSGAMYRGQTYSHIHVDTSQILNTHVATDSLWLWLVLIVHMCMYMYTADTVREPTVLTEEDLEKEVRKWIIMCIVQK